MGNWGATYPYEQDIAIEEISPFNNRFLLLSLLFLPNKIRKKENPIFYKKIIKNLWEDCLNIPVNPILNNNIYKELKNKVKNNVIFYKFYKSLLYSLKKSY